MTVQTQIKVTDAMLMHLVIQPRSLCKITTFLNSKHWSYVLMNEFNLQSYP